MRLWWPQALEEHRRSSRKATILLLGRYIAYGALLFMCMCSVLKFAILDLGEVMQFYFSGVGIQRSDLKCYEVIILHRLMKSWIKYVVRIESRTSRLRWVLPWNSLTLWISFAFLRFLQYCFFTVVKLRGHAFWKAISVCLDQDNLGKKSKPEQHVAFIASYCVPNIWCVFPLALESPQRGDKKLCGNIELGKSYQQTNLGIRLRTLVCWILYYDIPLSQLFQQIRTNYRIP